MIKERIQYPSRYSVVWKELFDKATERALHDYENGRVVKYKEPLGFLYEAKYPTNSAAAMKGATYKSLAYIAHRMNISGKDRQSWYELARGIPLSQAHVGLIIARLDERDTMLSGLETMLEEVA